MSLARLSIEALRVPAASRSTQLQCGVSAPTSYTPESNRTKTSTETTISKTRSALRITIRIISRLDGVTAHATATEPSSARGRVRVDRPLSAQFEGSVFPPRGSLPQRPSDSLEQAQSREPSTLPIMSHDPSYPIPACSPHAG